MKFRISLIGLLGVVLIAGCGNSSDDISSQISIGSEIVLTPPSGIEQIPSKLVENRQITNKIVYSGKIPLTEDQINDGERYATNFIVTQSTIATGITYDQFAQVTLDKMQQYMIGYERGEMAQVTFDCNGEEVQGVQASFLIEDSYYQSQTNYQFYHYQFVHKGVGYILSLAGLPSDSRSLRRTFTRILDSLECT